MLFSPSREAGPSFEAGKNSRPCRFRAAAGGEAGKVKMAKSRRIGAILVAAGAVFVSGPGPTKPQILVIVQLNAPRLYQHQLLEVRYRSYREQNEKVQVKIFALCRRNQETSVFSGTYSLPPFGKGTRMITGHLTPGEIKQFGQFKQWRVEFWEEGVLLAEKNQPSLNPGELSWWKDDSRLAGNVGFDVTRQKLEDQDEDD